MRATSIQLIGQYLPPIYLKYNERIKIEKLSSQKVSTKQPKGINQMAQRYQLFHRILQLNSLTLKFITFCVKMQQSGTMRLDPPCQQIGGNYPRKCQDLERTQNGSMIMNERNLKIICQNQGLYEYPQMNSKIYLHFKVIQRIDSLEKYRNLRTIYLQNNVITRIQNLDCLVYLQNLFLQNNMIKKIQNLQKLKQLKVINLSNNNIFRIEGLSELLYLQNLNLSNNYSTEFEDLQHLGQCTTQLTSIDLSDNHIKPDSQLLNLIPQVKCLYLSGNPLVKQTKHYRRVVVGTLKNLLYLDQRGIDKEERMLSEAWVQGGQKAFKETKQKVQHHRKIVKEQKRQQIMKDIDVHRNRKINIFLRNMKQFEEQIQKLRAYINEKGSQDMTYFYETKIGQLYQKIRQNQEFVHNINKRIGAAAKSVSSEQNNNSCNQDQKLICQSESQGQTKDLILEQIEDKQLSGQEQTKQLKLNLPYVNQTETDAVDVQHQNNNSDQSQIKESYSEESSELSFSQNQYIPQFDKAQLKKLIPASSTGLDELD